LSDWSLGWICRTSSSSVADSNLCLSMNIILLFMNKR
jgi:hypothetical protein